MTEKIQAAMIVIKVVNEQMKDRYLDSLTGLAL
jgi:hypothetical protein